jgi:hypothetical protein
MKFSKLVHIKFKFSTHFDQPHLKKEEEEEKAICETLAIRFIQAFTHQDFWLVTNLLLLLLEKEEDKGGFSNNFWNWENL